MNPYSESSFAQFFTIWQSGGWLMLPLFFLAVFIYYTAIDLYLGLSRHFLVHKSIRQLSDDQLLATVKRKNSPFNSLLQRNQHSLQEIRRHFDQIRHMYLPFVNNRIRFLAIITSIGPLMGLLGTVSGMLVTFRGMASSQTSKFENVVQGISEALITTQTGLIISIPMLLVLPLIIRYRNRMKRSIERLEYINMRLFAPTPDSL